LALGIAASIAIHLLLLMVGFGSTVRQTGPFPLTVEIRALAVPEAITEITAPDKPPEPSAAPADNNAAVPDTLPEMAVRAPVAPAAPIEFNLPIDNRYHTMREVDVPAEPINHVDLLYPKRAYAMRTKGKVVLRIFINEYGAIDEISLLEAVPPGVFEDAALTATQSLQFRPALKQGRNVKSQKTIEVVFDPYESINIP
jgi:periplasmic protein TonB